MEGDEVRRSQRGERCRRASSLCKTLSILSSQEKDTFHMYVLCSHPDFALVVGEN